MSEAACERSAATHNAVVIYSREADYAEHSPTADARNDAQQLCPRL
jgi:hypothetical protein